MKAKPVECLFVVVDDMAVIDKAVRSMAPYMDRYDYCSDPAGLYGDLKQVVGTDTARRIMREMFPHN